MSSNKTLNLNLHLWEAKDAFLRSEFNQNSQLLDDAYSELKTKVNKNHSVLMDSVSDKPLDGWNVVFDRINLTDAWRMELMLDCPTTCGDICVRINNLETGYVQFGLDGTARTNQTCLAVLRSPGKQPFRLEFFQMNEGSYVSTQGTQLICGENGSYSKESLDAVAPVLWENVTRINLVPVNGTIPAGTHLYLRAVRK